MSHPNSRSQRAGMTHVKVEWRRTVQAHRAGVLPALVGRASLLLDRATHDNVPVVVEDVVREECRLLHARSPSGLRSSRYHHTIDTDPSSQIRCRHRSGTRSDTVDPNANLMGNSIKRCREERLVVCLESYVSDGNRVRNGTQTRRCAAQLKRTHFTAQDTKWLAVASHCL